VGVSAESVEEAEFFVMSTRTLSTFSKEEAQRYESYGHQKIEQVIRIPCVSINDLLHSQFTKTPDLVSIDVEGKDFEILQAFDFSMYRPAVFCLETLTYTEDKSEDKLREVIDFMLTRDYMNYADTYVNTIFVDRQKWQHR
jgi:hypothetical protein